MDSKKYFSNFCGISRKDYPKWEGWKIIDFYRSKKILASQIQSKELDSLTRSFWLVKKISETL